MTTPTSTSASKYTSTSPATPNNGVTSPLHYTTPDWTTESSTNIGSSSTLKLTSTISTTQASTTPLTTPSSGVQLSSDPKIIQTILTQDMQMSCSFNDTSGGDLRFVTSLVIIRNGVEIASITPFAPVYAPADAGI